MCEQAEIPFNTRKQNWLVYVISKPWLDKREFENKCSLT